MSFTHKDFSPHGAHCPRSNTHSSLYGYGLSTGAVEGLSTFGPSSRSLSTSQQQQRNMLLSVTAVAAEIPPLRSPKEFETIYNMVRTDGIFMLKHSDLELQSNLGKGNFGSVMRGTYRLRGKVIDVAVKVLKANDATAEVSGLFHLILRFVCLLLYL